MNKFQSAVTKVNNVTTTLNGDKGYKSTGSRLLDMFTTFGNMRGEKESKILHMFNEAFEENELDALKLLFYFRDIREGAGTRFQFQVVMKWLAQNRPEIVKKNIQNIIEFGYFGDLYCFFGTQLETFVIKYWFDQVLENNLLAAKWIPTESQSLRNRTYIDKVLKIVESHFDYSPRDYRKLISDLRSKANLIEKLMSENKWQEIDYGKLPSKAGVKYRKAFFKHDADRYAKYLEKATKGEVKFNAGTLTPIDIVSQYKNVYEDSTLEAAWNNLKNVFGEGNKNILPIADCSGSMTSSVPKTKFSCLDVCHALTAYCAQFNTTKGFEQLFGVFSSDCKFGTFKKNSTLKDKLDQLKKYSDVANTNILSVFKKIIDIAKQNNLSSEDIPNLLFITDGQFDSQITIGENHRTSYETALTLFKQAGYVAPKILFWNVAAYEAKPVYKNDTNTMMFSGYSQNILKAVLENLEVKDVTPMDLMNTVLNKERYSVVKL